MSIAVRCAGCSKEFKVKEDYAGRRIKCPACEGTIQVPDRENPFAAVEAPRAAPVRTVSDVDDSFDDPILDRDLFLINQKLFSISEAYSILTEDKKPLLWVRRPQHILRSVGAILAFIFLFFFGVLVTVLAGAGVSEVAGKSAGAVVGVIVGVTLFAGLIALLIYMMPKRHIQFFLDEKKTKLSFEVLQDTKLQILLMTFTVVDPAGTVLGRCRKNVFTNILRRSWWVAGPDGEDILVAREDSWVMSIARRLFGPMMGLLRTNFVLMRVKKDGVESLIGEFNRKFTLFDRYVLDLTYDPKRRLDRRVALGLAVLLDSGERR